MSTQVQFRRGTTAQNNSFTGAVGEITVDTTDNTLRVHDGATAGGFTTVGTTTTQTLTNKTLGAFTLTGNITGNANISGYANVVGNIISGGNISGSFFLGNGSLLTGIDATSIQSGTSNVRVVSSGGNVTVGVGGTSNVTVFSTGGANIAGYLTATGNVTGGNLLTAGLVSATGNITATANVTGGNLTTAGILTVNSGNAATAIVNGGGNAVGNIGSSTARFDTAFVLATSAQYADLAEMYEADAAYAPGTVVSFGGKNEITISTNNADKRVAGVVSTNPSYIMNAVCSGDYPIAVALTGKVPTKVTGSVRKGDMMVSNGDGTARSEPDPKIGTVLGKAIEDFSGDTGTINIVVGRL